MLSIIANLSVALFAAEAPPAAAAPVSAPASPPTTEGIFDLLFKIWHFPIAEIDKQPLTVSSVVIGVILLLIGVKVSRALSNQFGRKVLPRFHMEPGATSALQSLAYYASCWNERTVVAPPRNKRSWMGSV
jgi:hypothetical protein